MRRIALHLLCLISLTISAVAWSATSNVELSTTGTPAGFDELASPRVLLVDVYFGGRKVGEALVTTSPGALEFRSVEELFSKIPQLIDSPELRSALEGKLSTNSDAVCRQSNASSCGTLTPDVAGIIYDGDHFRVDLFVNPRFLRTARAEVNDYLPIPDAPLSLTSSVGLAASGTLGGSSVYNLQNRTVIGFENARIRMNSSIASDLGLVMDDLVGELDRKNLRYSAGLFWAPGDDFTGQRRILGAGFGTQFDTWANQQSLHGTPLILFLPQSSRVELLIDGRLISSRSYPAGNVEVDTSALPDGSYSVLLRIHQSNGMVREEQRFFVKNAEAPPVGHPIFYAYAGMLANTRRHQPISVSKTLYYQAGGAWRLTSNLAFDVGAIGTQHKAMAQAGAWLIVHDARFRIAGLASTSGDAGALLQGAWGGRGPLNISFDLRRIWSRNGQPLIPLPSYVESFGETPPTGLQLATGSYTQATGSIGLRLGSGFIGVVGSYRKDRSLPADYAIGPTINWPLVSHRQFQLVLDASAQRTRSTTVGFAGVRVLFSRGGMSLLGSVGQSTEKDRGERSFSRTVGNLAAQYSHESEDGTVLNVEAGADREVDSATVNAGATVSSRFGNARADLLHSIEGRKWTQYDLSYEAGIAVSSHSASLSGRDLEQSALIVTVHGDSNAEFNVLVDESVRGRVKAGQRLSLFVPGYRKYDVRLVPISSAPVDYDAATREVTLYPGNVQTLQWSAESFFTIFAQAITSSGTPIADALVQSSKGISETDSNGYFQIDVRQGDPISLDQHGGQSCQVRIPKLVVKGDFASIGKVVCS